MNPLKQGLKLLMCSNYHILPKIVKEVNPLKQGLKRKDFGKNNVCTSHVKEVNPLKQGLKLSSIIYSKLGLLQLKK